MRRAISCQNRAGFGAHSRIVNLFAMEILFEKMLESPKLLPKTRVTKEKTPHPDQYDSELTLDGNRVRVQQKLYGQYRSSVNLYEECQYETRIAPDNAIKDDSATGRATQKKHVTPKGHVTQKDVKLLSRETFLRTNCAPRAADQPKRYVSYFRENVYAKEKADQGAKDQEKENFAPQEVSVVEPRHVRAVGQGHKVDLVVC